MYEELKEIGSDRYLIKVIGELRLTVKVISVLSRSSTKLIKDFNKTLDAFIEKWKLEW